MRKIGRICIVLGCLLIAGSLALFLTMQVGTAQAQRCNAQVVQRIGGILPPLQPGIRDAYIDMTMPVLELDGTDYAALLDIPALGLTLPVADVWDKGAVRQQPCRFSGTVYDGSLIIGGSDRAGQFSCFDRMQPGNEVSVTDMTGTVFSYVVDRIDRASSASAAVLTAGESDLTLFVRDAYGLEYILLRCVVK